MTMPSSLPPAAVPLPLRLTGETRPLRPSNAEPKHCDDNHTLALTVDPGAPDRAGAGGRSAQRLCDAAMVTTAAAFALPVGELNAPTRRSPYAAFARQSAMYLAHVAFGLTYTEIGRGFGRDRTTAAYACRLVEDWRDDPAVELGTGVAGERLRRVAPQADREGAAMSGKNPVMPDQAMQRLLAERVGVEPLRARHLDLAEIQIDSGEGGVVGVTIDAAESPLAWLARRKGRDGRTMIEPMQLQAGERLRADFTCAQLMPRITANWNAAVADGRRGASPGHFTETMIAARQRVRHALDAVGPEFSGLLVDVCCFLKGLAQIESERGWPSRSAKVVLQLGLDRLARHYGLTRVARGQAQGEVRTWLAEDAAFTVGVGE